MFAELRKGFAKPFTFPSGEGGPRGAVVEESKVCTARSPNTTIDISECFALSAKNTAVYLTVFLVIPEVSISFRKLSVNFAFVCRFALTFGFIYVIII